MNKDLLDKIAEALYRVVYPTNKHRWESEPERRKRYYRNQASEALRAIKNAGYVVNVAVGSLFQSAEPTDPQPTNNDLQHDIAVALKNRHQLGGCENNFHYLAEAALKAIEDAGYSIEQGWQPIETAPKDGTLILALGPITSATVMWEPAHQCWASADNWPWEDFEPTHWRPLPEPPASTTEPEASDG